jgi:hypothetical protein
MYKFNIANNYDSGTRLACFLTGETVDPLPEKP